MKTRSRRLAHAYAVRAMRRLGRELQSGKWHPDAEPMTIGEVATVMGRALGTMLDLGLASVRDAFDAKMAELLGLDGE